MLNLPPRSIWRYFLPRIFALLSTVVCSEYMMAKRRATPPPSSVRMIRQCTTRSKKYNSRASSLGRGGAVVGHVQGRGCTYRRSTTPLQTTHRRPTNTAVALRLQWIEVMGDGCSPMSGRRRESTRPYSVWSQSARVMSAGGLLGVLMSVVYYRALGPPQLWVETVGGRGGGGGSWWLGGGKAGGVNVGGGMTRHTPRNLGSVGGGVR